MAVQASHLNTNSPKPPGYLFGWLAQTAATVTPSYAAIFSMAVGAELPHVYLPKMGSTFPASK